MNLRWQGILVGTLICLSLQVTLALLGTGLALLTAPLTLLGIGVAFLGGGMATLLFEKPMKHGLAVFHGIVLWALTSTFLLFFVGGRVTSVLGGVFVAAGIGGGTSQVTEMVASELSKMNLRVYSDMKLLQGKIVSDAFLTTRDHEEEKAVLAQQVLKKKAESASRTAFLAMGLGALAAAAGCLVGNAWKPKI